MVRARFTAESIAPFVTQQVSVEQGTIQRLAVRSPDADRGRPRRADLRGLDAAVGACRADRTSASRSDGDQQPLPASGDARQDRDDRRRRVRRTARPRDRCRVTTQPPHRPTRVRRTRLAVRGRGHAVGSLGEACTIIRRLWTQERAVRLRRRVPPTRGSVREPQARPAADPAEPHRRALRRGVAHRRRTRRPVEHPGGDIADCVARSTLLDRYCDEIGRDPASIIRSIFLGVSYDDPSATRKAIGHASEAGFQSTSSSDCRDLTRPVSHGGWPTS